MIPKVHHFNSTTLCPLSRRLVNGSGGLLERAEMVCHCWVIEGKDGLTLVDTGVGRQDLRDVSGRLGAWFGMVVHPVALEHETAFGGVQRLGFKPEDVRHIIPTHLDLDHAGGLPDFPWATVHVFQDELTAALHPRTLGEKQRYRPTQWAHGPQWDARALGGDTWLGFQSVRAMGPDEDVLLIPLPGHTRGHCGVAVKTETGWLLHAGDAYFFHGEMDHSAECPPALTLFQRMAAVDNTLRMHNRRRLQELVGEHRQDVVVHSAHCPVELQRMQGKSVPHVGHH